MDRRWAGDSGSLGMLDLSLTVGLRASCCFSTVSSQRPVQPPGTWGGSSSTKDRGPKSFHSNRKGRLGDRRACSPEGEPVGVNLLAVISFFRVSRLHSSPGCKRLLPSLGKAAQPRYQRLSQHGGIRDDFLHGFASWRFLIFCSEHNIWAIK